MRISRPAIVIGTALAGLALGTTTASADGPPVPWTVTNDNTPAATAPVHPSQQPWTVSNDTGQAVTAPSTSSTPSTKADAPSTSTVHVYTHHHHSSGTWLIQPGNTLSEISAATGVSIRTLAKRNGITNPDMIFAGNTLVIH